MPTFEAGPGFFLFVQQQGFRLDGCRFQSLLLIVLIGPRVRAHPRTSFCYFVPRDFALANPLPLIRPFPLTVPPLFDVPPPLLSPELGRALEAGVVNFEAVREEVGG